MALFCWQIRGCEAEKELFEHCPHRERGGRCAVDCAFAECDRATHKPVTDPLMFLDATIDRSAAQKEGCLLCAYFYEHGPRIPEAEEE